MNPASGLCPKCWANETVLRSTDTNIAPSRKYNGASTTSPGAGSSVVGFILDAHGPRAGYAFAAACGAAAAATCLLGLSRLRSPKVPALPIAPQPLFRAYSLARASTSLTYQVAWL